MDLLRQLWLPIVVSAAAVWFWSFLSWAALSLHKRDRVAPPDEDGLMEAVRRLGLGPGSYMFPWIEHKDQRDPAKVAKWKAGPIGTLTVFGPMSMPANMLASFGWNLLSSFLIGYVAAEAPPRGADFGKVMQVVGTVGVLAYTTAGFTTLIWFQGRPNAKVMHVVDGVVQGLATGAVFAAMWPGA